jgi:hypothetical protein
MPTRKDHEIVVEIAGMQYNLFRLTKEKTMEGTTQ